MRRKVEPAFLSVPKAFQVRRPRITRISQGGSAATEVAQTSKSAVSFRPADLEIGGTSGLETCATA
ncbi:MAG: hypothetical protein DME76_09335 [Verrucomicrobia bacterium]|nr:MAG: hypothetical protein DME76_09335 [Verrucomicrobiota bacterium]